MTEFTTRMLPITSLKPAPYNPRQVLKPGQPAYEKLRKSLEQFGLVEPLIWNETTGYLVGGHARLGILQELGVTEVPVSVVRLSPAREKALNILLNNAEAQGRYDPGKLAEVLLELEPLPELALTGFTAEHIKSLRLDPLPAVPPPAPSLPGTIECTLVLTPAQWQTLHPVLDGWIREHNLIAHTRMP